jgi:uncharacterized protein YkwD
MRLGLSGAVLAGVLAAACTVRPMTPPPDITATLRPAGQAVVTFTPTAAPPATETPVPAPPFTAAATTPVPTDTAAPTLPPVQADRPQAAPAPAATLPPAPPATSVPEAVQPTPAPLPVAAAAPDGDVAAAEQYTIDLINIQRAAAGVPALARDETLMGIARARVNDMVARGYTGHNDPVTGAALGKDWMRAAGYTSPFVGENWYGSIKPPPAIVEIAMAWFMTDPPHYRNILSPNYVGVGVGIAYNGRQWLLVQNFAGAN